MSRKGHGSSRFGDIDYQHSRLAQPGVDDFTVVPSENPGNIDVTRDAPFPNGAVGSITRAYTSPGGVLALERQDTDTRFSLNLIPGLNYTIKIAWKAWRGVDSPFHDFGVVQAEPEG